MNREAYDHLTAWMRDQEEINKILREELAKLTDRVQHLEFRTLPIGPGEKQFLMPIPPTKEQEEQISAAIEAAFAGEDKL